MPINEARRRARRERYPLEFDLEGIPQDRKYRDRLLESKRQEFCTLQTAKEKFMSENNFAVDFLTPAQKQQLLQTLLRETAGGEELDLSKPKVAPYRFQEFPKFVYHHETGHAMQVKTQQQQDAAVKRGYQLKPSPGHDYSKMNAQGFAPEREDAPQVEEGFTAEQIEQLDQAEAADAAMRANGGYQDEGDQADASAADPQASYTQGDASQVQESPAPSRRRRG